MTALILFLPAFIACGGDDETEKTETTDTATSTTTDSQTETGTETETETETEQAESILTLAMDDERKYDSQGFSYEGTLEMTSDGLTGTIEYKETANDEVSCSASLLASGNLDEDACNEVFSQNEVCYTYTYTIDTEEGECAFTDSGTLNLSDQNCTGYLAYTSNYVDEDYPDESQENVITYGYYCEDGGGYSVMESGVDQTQPYGIWDSTTEYQDRLFADCDNSDVYSEVTENFIGASAITGNLTCVNETDVADIYTFEATAGQTLTSTALTTEESIELYLLDSNDCLLKVSDWSSYECSDDYSPCKSVSHTIPADGTYKLMVASSWCWSSFDYEIDAQLQ